MKINDLYHGSDESFTKFSNGFKFFFIHNPELASTYGTNVYECSAEVSNPFELDEGDDLEKSQSGMRYAGTSPTTKRFIRDVLSGLSESDITHALEIYRKNGFGSVSPARVFLDRYDLLVKYLNDRGYDSMIFRDESAMGASHGVFPALIVFDASTIDIEKVIVYDDYYGEVEKSFTYEQWTKKLVGTLTESIDQLIDMDYSGVGDETKQQYGKNCTKLVDPYGSVRYILDDGIKNIAAIQIMVRGNYATVGTIYVKPEYRRRGIATELFNLAKSEYPTLQHSDTLTTDGEKFVAAMNNR